jgi:transcriptional regulator with XRE-family HTH domain
MKLVVNSHQVSMDGEKLSYWRGHRKLSQTQLARKAGISRSYIAEIERGERRPRMLVANAIARALKVDLEQITS